MTKALPIIGLVVFAALTLAAPVPNIVELAISTPDLSTLVTALKAGKLVTALTGGGPYYDLFTVFAPTNEAFAKLPKAMLASLLEPANIFKLDDILKYHVIAGAAVYAEGSCHSPSLFCVQLKNGTQHVGTLDGKQLRITKSGSSVTVQNAHVITADVAASNGVVHIIDGVLTPPGAKNIVELAAFTPDLSTLVSALAAGDLVDVLSAPGPFTVFAPTNEAFAKLPKATLASLLDPKNIKELDDILKYHVIAGADVYVKDLKASQDVTTYEGKQLRITKSGSSVTAQKAHVITADVSASNGIVHIIDGVLMPPVKTIVQLAAFTPDLSTFVTALKAGNLTAALSGAGPFTVFAPCNEAFAKLPKDTLASLLDPKNIKQLDDILKYHVIAGVALYLEDLKAGSQDVTTLEGKQLHITSYGPPVTVQKAHVITPDVYASNGVVHIIDGVLMPPAPS